MSAPAKGAWPVAEAGRARSCAGLVIFSRIAELSLDLLMSSISEALLAGGCLEIENDPQLYCGSRSDSCRVDGNLRCRCTNRRNPGLQRANRRTRRNQLDSSQQLHARWPEDRRLSGWSCPQSLVERRPRMGAWPHPLVGSRSLPAALHSHGRQVRTGRVQAPQPFRRSTRRRKDILLRRQFRIQLQHPPLGSVQVYTGNPPDRRLASRPLGFHRQSHPGQLVERSFPARLRAGKPDRLQCHQDLAGRRRGVR